MYCVRVESKDGLKKFTDFPYGVIEIEKESIEEACDWFVQYLYPMFDRMVGENGDWRIKIISATENGNDVLKKVYDFV